MRILHLMLACFYIDNYSYQENMLPKFHKLAGNDVEIIASLFTFDENGKGKWLKHRASYVNEYGIPVTRLEFSKSLFSRTLRIHKGLEKEIERANPEIIFIHGVQFLDIRMVIKYVKKHPSTTVFVDNHSDFSNSAQNWLSLNILHGVLWKRCAQKILPYVTKFYGVLPARVDFLCDIYSIPPDKVDLLVMGADDAAVLAAAQTSAVNEIRSKNGIAEDDFLVVTGGKIDNFKRQTLLLMDAVNCNKESKLKLIIFGSVVPELQAEVQKRCSDRVKYIGWIEASESYGYFAAADLVVFPGRHSVFWEQVVAQAKPMLVKWWAGTTHVDCGGNVRFLKNDSAEEMSTAIREIMAPKCYSQMQDAAKRASAKFMYSKIARESIR